MGTLAQEGFLLLFRLEKRSLIVFCCFLYLSFIDMLSFCLFARATGTTDICGAIDFFLSFSFSSLPRLREGLEFWGDAFPGEAYWVSISIVDIANARYLSRVIT